jgi:hypothetical protein
VFYRLLWGMLGVMRQCVGVLGSFFFVVCLCLWLHLVGILFPHIIDDARRSKPHQIHT